MKKLSLVLLLLCTCQVSAMEHNNYGNYINDKYNYNKSYANNHFNNIEVNNKNHWYERINSDTLVTIKTEQTDNNREYKILNMINGNNHNLLNSIYALGNIRSTLFPEIIDYKNQPNNGDLILNKFEQQSGTNYFVSNKLKELVDNNNVIIVPNSCESAYDAMISCYLRIMMKQLSNTKYNDSFHVINYNKNLINIIDDIKITYGYSNIYTSFEYNKIVLSNFRTNNDLSNMKYCLSNNNLKQNLLQTNSVPVRNDSIVNPKSKFDKLKYRNNIELNNKSDNISTRSNSPEYKQIMNKIKKKSNNSKNKIISQNDNNSSQDLDDIKLFQPKLYKRTQDIIDHTNINIEQINIPKLNFNNLNITESDNSNNESNVEYSHDTNYNISISENSGKHNNHRLNDSMIQQNMKNIEIQIQNMIDNISEKVINTNEFNQIIKNYYDAYNNLQKFSSMNVQHENIEVELTANYQKCFRNILILIMQQYDSDNHNKYTNLLSESIRTGSTINSEFSKVLLKISEQLHIGSINISDEIQEQLDNIAQLFIDDIFGFEDEYEDIIKEVDILYALIDDEYMDNIEYVESFKYNIRKYIEQYIDTEQYIDGDPKTCIKIIVTVIQKWFDKEEHKLYYDKLLEQLLENNINNASSNIINSEDENNINDMRNPTINKSFNDMKNPIIYENINDMRNPLIKTNYNQNMINTYKNLNSSIKSREYTYGRNNIDNDIDKSIRSDDTGMGNPIFRQLKHENNRNNIVLYNNKYYNEDNNEMNSNSVFNNNKYNIKERNNSINYIGENSIISYYNNKIKYNIENSDIDINNIEYDSNQNETNNNIIQSNSFTMKNNISAPNILYLTKIPNIKEKYNNINNQHNNIKPKQLQQKKYLKEKVTNVIFSRRTGENNIDKLFNYLKTNKPVLNESNLSNYNENLTIKEIKSNELNKFWY